MNRQEKRKVSPTRTARENGFSLLELLFTLSIIGVASALAVIGVVQARENMRIQLSLRQLAGNLERTRTDAMRRRARDQFAGGVANWSRIEVPDGVPRNVYNVYMDYNGDGVLGANEFRSLRLQDGVTFDGLASGTQVIRFDWRGRTAGTATLSLRNSRSLGLTINGFGDVAVNHPVAVPSMNVNFGIAGGAPSPTPTP